MNKDEMFFKSPSAEEFFKTLRNELLQTKRPATEIHLDDVDLRTYLKVSKRYTANLRAKRLITFYKLGGKLYYKLSDVLDYIEKHKVSAIPESSRLLQSKKTNNEKKKM